LTVSSPLLDEQKDKTRTLYATDWRLFLYWSAISELCNLCFWVGWCLSWGPLYFALVVSFFSFRHGLSNEPLAKVLRLEKIKGPRTGLRSLPWPWPWPWPWIGSRSHQNPQHIYDYQQTRPCDSSVQQYGNTWPCKSPVILTFREVWSHVIAFWEGNSKIGLWQKRSRNLTRPTLVRTKSEVSLQLHPFQIWEMRHKVYIMEPFPRYSELLVKICQFTHPNCVRRPMQFGLPQWIFAKILGLSCSVDCLVTDWVVLIQSYWALHSSAMLTRDKN